jgi:hypothetical protein
VKRINVTYWITLIVWLIFAFGFMAVNRYYAFLKPDDINMLLGIIAVAVSILSLGLATIKKPTFNGKVCCWNVESKKRHVNNEVVTPIGIYSCLTFRIDNKNNEPIKDLIINFRFPTNLIHRRIQLDNFYSFYEFKDTVLLTAKNISFLGSNSGDSDIVFEHLLNLDKWNSNRKMYITVSGSNITPTTKCIDFNMIDKLKQSTTTNPLQLT